MERNLRVIATTAPTIVVALVSLGLLALCLLCLCLFCLCTLPPGQPDITPTPTCNVSKTPTATPTATDTPLMNSAPVTPAAGGVVTTQGARWCTFVGTANPLFFDGDVAWWMCASGDGTSYALLGDVQATSRGWEVDRARLVRQGEAWVVQERERVRVTGVELAGGTQCTSLGAPSGVAPGGRPLRMVCQSADGAQTALLGDMIPDSSGWRIEWAELEQRGGATAVRESTLVLVMRLAVEPLR